MKGITLLRIVLQLFRSNVEISSPTASLIMICLIEYHHFSSFFPLGTAVALQIMFIQHLLTIGKVVRWSHGSRI